MPVTPISCSGSARTLGFPELRACRSSWADQSGTIDARQQCDQAASWGGRGSWDGGTPNPPLVTNGGDSSR